MTPFVFHAACFAVAVIALGVNLMHRGLYHAGLRQERPVDESEGFEFY